MIQNLWNDVLITAIGMGLVFVAILLLWGLMALIVLIPDGAATEEKTAPGAPATDAVVVEAAGADPLELGLKQQAAAAAVAIALASDKTQKKSSPMLADLIPTVSAWQAFHRTNLIGVKQLKGHGR